MKIELEEIVQSFLDQKGKLVIDCLVDIGFCDSKSEAKRMIKQRSVKINDVCVNHVNARVINFGNLILVEKDDDGIIQVRTF